MFTQPFFFQAHIKRNIKDRWITPFMTSTMQMLHHDLLHMSDQPGHHCDVYRCCILVIAATDGLVLVDPSMHQTLISVMFTGILVKITSIPVNITEMGPKWASSFLPEASFGLRVLSLPASVCVCLSVCLSVCQSLACPRDNSGPVQARIAKFGPKMQKTLVKVPIVLGSNWPWPSRSNLTSKSEFTQFWACPDHNSLPIQARITKFGLEVENSLVKVAIVLVAIDLDLQGQIWFKQWIFFYQTYLRCFCKYLVRPSPVYI